MSEIGSSTDMSEEKSNPFTAVPIEVTVTVGKSRPLFRDLVRLKSNAILPLDKTIDDPVELFVGDKLIAKGLLEESPESSDGALVVRLTEILGMEPSG